MRAPPPLLLVLMTLPPPLLLVLMTLPPPLLLVLMPLPPPLLLVLMTVPPPLRLVLPPPPPLLMPLPPSRRRRRRRRVSCVRVARGSAVEILARWMQASHAAELAALLVRQLLVWFGLVLLRAHRAWRRTWLAPDVCRTRHGLAHRGTR